MNNMTKIKAHFMHNDQKMAKTEIAKEFDVSPSTVSRWIKDVESAKIAAATVTIIEEPEIEIEPKVVQRRKIWTFTPTKVQRKAKIEQTQKQQSQMPQTAMSLAFNKAVNAG